MAKKKTSPKPFYIWTKSKTDPFHPVKYWCGSVWFGNMLLRWVNDPRSAASFETVDAAKAVIAEHALDGAHVGEFVL